MTTMEKKSPRHLSYTTRADRARFDGKGTTAKGTTPNPVAQRERPFTRKNSVSRKS